MLALDYTKQGRRPTAQQIVSDWKKAGQPKEFTAEYGETYAHFEYAAPWGPPRWYGDGNGCRGVNRDKVERLLNAVTNKSQEED